MNIWIINHYAITPDMPGGTRHYDFGKELVKRGHKVAIIASSFNYIRHRELKLAKNEKYKFENTGGINFIWLKTFPYQKNDWRRALNMLSFMWRAYWIGTKMTQVNKEIRNPDVIIGSSVHLFAVLSAYFLSKHYKAKFIMEVRDLWPQTIIDIGFLSRKNPIILMMRVLEKFLYQRAEKIISLLPQGFEYITKLDIPKEKIIWIPNGVDLAKYKKLEEYQGSISNVFTLMYTGYHGPANALEVILEADKILDENLKKRVKFIFVGNGLEKKNLINLANNMKLRNVEFWEQVPKEKMAEVLSKADAFIFTLKNLSLFKYGLTSNKIFDYLISGRPILFAANYSNNPLKSLEIGFIIPPENPKALAQSIQKLISLQPDERIKMGERGVKYVKKYYDIRILADKLGKVIQEVVNGKAISKNR